MSRIGKLPIAIPSNVEVTLDDNSVTVKGPKGELTQTINENISLSLEDGTLTVCRPNDEKTTRALHGLTRALVANMVQGVTDGFEKKLEILGVGYRFTVQGDTVNLSLGFSHPVEMKAPTGVSVEPDADNKQVLVIKGIDKQAVGQFAAEIRRLRKPEPYKGKGIRYLGEYVRRKAGKSASKK